MMPEPSLLSEKGQRVCERNGDRRRTLRVKAIRIEGTKRNSHRWPWRRRLLL
ncbi:hypothetical protein WN48_01031 [Eufriesea mexicana]|nr:hypothetical protein WN48_01031 [Eufriesea mexicana]